MSPNHPLPSLYFEPGAFMHKNAVAIWIGFGAAACALTLAVGWSAPERADFLCQTLPLAVSLAAIPLAIHYVCDQIAAAFPFWGRFLQPSDDFPKPREDFSSWFTRELAVLRPSWAMSVSGAALVGVRLLTKPWQHPELSDLQAAYVCGLAVLTAFFAGVALWHIVLFSRVVHRFGNFRVRVDAHRFGVRGVGDVMSLAWSVGALIWVVITSTVVLDGHVETAPLLFVAVPACCLLVGSFVICQLPLHRGMQLFKRETLHDLERALDHLLDKGFASLSEKETRDVEFLEKRIAATLSLPEWPFQWRKLVQIGSLAFSFLFSLSGKLGPLLSDPAAWSRSSRAASVAAPSVGVTTRVLVGAPPTTAGSSSETTSHAALAGKL